MAIQEGSNRNVYLLGAGFSADANAPLVHDFLDKAHQLLDDPDSHLDGIERAQFERVFEFRREMAQSRDKIRIDLDDIEQLFGLVEISVRLGFEEPAVRQAMVYVIAKTL